MYCGPATSCWLCVVGDNAVADALEQTINGQGSTTTS